VAEPASDHPQPAPLGVAAKQDLGDGEGNQLGVGQLGLAAGSPAGAEQVVDADVQCGDEGVEIGVHEASQQVDVGFATPILGTLASVVTPRHPTTHSEAII
jgi:hypothetical protein